VRRSRSNTPLQALTTLNEPLFVECAQALALRALVDGGSTNEQRLSYAFRRCVSRGPTQEESKALLDMLAKQTRRFTTGELDSEKLVSPASQTPVQLPEGINTAELAGWTVVSRVLLNLDETITKE